MNLFQNNKPRVLFLITAVIFTVVLTLAFFSRLYAEGRDCDLFLSSDALYLPSIYQDIVVENNRFDTWHLNPAPNFFPDMGFYFVLRFLCGNFIWATFCFALIQVLVLQALFLTIFRSMFPQKTLAYGAVIILGLSLFGFESLFFTKDPTFAFHPFSNSYHVGAFLVTLLCYMLCRKIFERPRLLPMVVLFLLCLMTTASDRLFLILFPAPFFVTTLVVWAKKRPGLTFGVILLVAVSSFAGLMLFNAIDRNSYEVLNQRMLADKGEMINSWSHLSENITTATLTLGFKPLIICGTFLSFILLVITAIKSRTQAPAVYQFSVFVICFTVIVMMAPVLSGKYLGYDCLRYNIFPFFLIGLNLAVSCAWLFKTGREFSRPYLPIGLLAFLSVVVTFRIDKEGLQKYFYHYPPLVAQLDSLADSHDLRQGVGNYWVAKKVTMFSKKNIKIRSVFDDLSIYDHVSNDLWFFDNMFTFVVLNRFQDTTLYRKGITVTGTVVYNDKLKLIKSEPFGYRREIGYRVAPPK